MGTANRLTKVPPEKDGFYYEFKEASYALIIIAARENNANNADVQKFVKAFQSPEVANPLNVKDGLRS